MPGFPEWREANAKEKSEILRNLVSAVAIVIGGAWVLYEWRTLFPKTEADVLAAAAAVRADVTGVVALALGRGLEAGFADAGEPIGFANGSDLIAFCDEGSPDRAFYARMPVAMSVTLTSASEIPVRVALAEFELARLDLGSSALVEGVAPAVFTVPPARSQSDPLRDEAFVGGLSWTRVERDREATLALAVQANLPFTCADQYNQFEPPLFVFGVRSTITPIDPRSGRELTDDAVEKAFTAACQVTADLSSRCDLAHFRTVAQ